MNPPSLQNRIVATLPFKELEAICFDLNNSLNNTFLYPCQWDLWRERAAILYGTSAAFFDLPRTFGNLLIDKENNIIYPGRKISGIQRYIEVSNYYRLNPEAAVKVYQPSHLVEGVYEKVAGYLQAEARGDSEALSLFGPFTPEEKLYLEKHRKEAAGYYAISNQADFTEPLYKTNKNRDLTPLSQRTGQEIFSLRDIIFYLRLGYVEAYLTLVEELRSYNILDIFLDVLRSGSSDLFDLSLQAILDINDEVKPEKKDLTEQLRNFRLERDIPLLPFDPQRKRFPLTDLGVLPDNNRDLIFGYTSQELLSAACYGGNLRIVDFFRSLFGERTLSPNLAEVEQGYLFHQKAEEFYAILQRWSFSSFGQLLSSSLLGNIDFLTYIFTRWGVQYIPRDIQKGLTLLWGNIPSFLTLLQFYDLLADQSSYSRESFYEVLALRTPDVFPLTRKIVQQRLEEVKKV